MARGRSPEIGRGASERRPVKAGVGDNSAICLESCGSDEMLPSERLREHAEARPVCSVDGACVNRFLSNFGFSRDAFPEDQGLLDSADKGMMRNRIPLVH
jgi:hypothetical protein